MKINKNMLLSYLFCLFLLSSLFISSISNIAYAQHNGNNYRHGYNHYGVTVGSTCELGKLTGWGAVVMLFCSTLPCILRRIVSSKPPDNNTKNFTNNIWQFFKCNHYVTGALALMLAILHGAIMITAREKGFILWIGMAAGMLMFITVFWGIALLQLRKKSSLFMHQSHMLFSLFSILLAIIHIIG